MAEETTVQEPVSQPQNSRREALALVVGVAGWLVPGLGHALLKMWGRAVICFLTVGVLVWVGAGMRGNAGEVSVHVAGNAFGILHHAARLRRMPSRHDAGLSRFQQSRRRQSSLHDRSGAARSDGGDGVDDRRRRPRLCRHVRAAGARCGSIDPDERPGHADADAAGVWRIRRSVIGERCYGR